MTNKERQKRYREKQKALRLAMDVTKKGESVTERDKSVTGVTEWVDEYNEERFPVKAAWEIAVERAVRARRYRELFPEFVGWEDGSRDWDYCDVEWQYENEGLKAVRKAETHLVK